MKSVMVPGARRKDGKRFIGMGDRDLINGRESREGGAFVVKGYCHAVKLEAFLMHIRASGMLEAESRGILLETASDVEGVSVTFPLLVSLAM